MKVIVAIDGSECSRTALDALENIKWAAGTQVRLMMVIERAETGFAFGAKRVDTAKQHQEMKAGAAEALKGIVAELEKTLPGCTTSFEVAEGHAKSHIAEYAKQWGADLVLIGSRGHKGVEVMLLGSVSQGVLMQADCPVLIVKSGKENAFEQILVALDNSIYSKAAMSWLKKIDWGDKCQFQLVMIVQPIIDSFDSIGSIANTASIQIQHDSLINAARSELEKYAAELGDAVGNDRVSIEVGEGDPREVILHIAATWGADLIVMGSHGKTGLTKLMLGSVSQAVALHSPVSVAIVKGIVPRGQGKLQQTGMYRKV